MNRHGGGAGRGTLAAGLALSGLALLLTWPAGVSFQDEVGYAGGARLLLEGRVRPSEATVTIWAPTRSGPVSKYPLFPSLPLVPFFFATVPLAAPAVAAVSLALLSWLASRVLGSWGVSRGWALVVAAHPSLVILARTLMPDLPLALLSLAAWWALRQDLRRGAVFLFALLILIKPTGILLALPMLAGEAWRRRGLPRGIGPFAWLLAPGVGIALGLAAVALLNLIQTGGLAYGYSFAPVERVLFSPAHLAVSGRALLLALLLVPPGLILGLAPWWRRREWGVVFPVSVLVALMAVYFHVDLGRGGLATLVLAPRLILPAVAFLAIGYGELLAGLARRIRAERWIVAALVAATPLVWLTAGITHQRWQQPMAEARRAAEARLEAEGERVLGLTRGAFKAGVASSRPVLWVPRSTEPRVVLCSTEVPTYHTDVTPDLSCDLPGYHAVETIGTYSILVRD